MIYPSWFYNCSAFDKKSFVNGSNDSFRSFIYKMNLYPPLLFFWICLFTFSSLRSAFLFLFWTFKVENVVEILGLPIGHRSILIFQNHVWVKYNFKLKYVLEKCDITLTSISHKLRNLSENAYGNDECICNCFIRGLFIFLPPFCS